jgi:energy-coupling factor transporter ATP-binding protein EcfA2
MSTLDRCFINSLQLSRLTTEIAISQRLIQMAPFKRRRKPKRILQLSLTFAISLPIQAQNNMPTALKQFQIDGLHGRNRTIDIPIRDNRLVLVGENGTGKSTVANILYYLLTQQWRRLADYRFNFIQVQSSDSQVRVTHEDVEVLLANKSVPLSRELRHRYPPHLLHSIARLVASESLFVESAGDFLADQIAEITRTSRPMAKEIILDIARTQGAKLKKPLQEELKKLESWSFGQFLYLPTYRRIEQDFKSIFGVEIEEKVREYRERFRKREKSSFIELIEFGMEDVERTIGTRMAQIKERVRTGLSSLTGTYLREVLAGLQEPDLSVLRSINPAAFQSLFARIDEATLPASDKQRLQEKIAEISKAAEYTIKQDDRVIAHFLSKLVALYTEQQEHESDVRDFVQTCNVYLTGKEFVYDDVEYSIYIRGTDERSVSTDQSNRLQLKVLSSGEKQIVSLFSHMYLSGQKDFFVVIDEPELSLSVPWQERFLPDIIKTERCTGLIAVTHSPFIWQNDFETYVAAFSEFVRPTK